METSIFFESHNELISMTNLPPEILGEIFKTYISTPSSSAFWEEGTVISTSTGDSPMILGQVCSYWRTIALGMPILWSSIYVEYPAPEHIPLVQMWLNRAGTCPLNLVLRDWVDSGNRECSEGTEGILKMFVEKSRNWRSIDFVLELRDFTILDMLEWDTCGNLEEAAVCARYCDPGVLDVFWRKVHQSSVLRNVDWYKAFKSSGGPIPRHAPWTQLKHIKTSSLLSDVDIAFILKACPELSSLDIQYYATTTNNSGSFLPQAPIVHKRLETFILNLACDSTPLFDHISLPGLQTLHLNNAYGFVHPDVDKVIGEPIEGFLRRSQCKLINLGICDFGNSHNINQLLQRILDIPSTRTLKHFDSSPIRCDILNLEAIAKHPTECVREAIRLMEKEMLCWPCERVLGDVDGECYGDDECGSVSFGEDGMTVFQSRLGLLHLD